MRTLLLFAALLVAAIAVRGADNGTEIADNTKRISSTEYKGEKSEIDFGRGVPSEELKTKSEETDDGYYEDEYVEENNEIPEIGKVQGDGEESDGKSIPGQVFLTVANSSDDGENFRTFKKRNDLADLQASASDNLPYEDARNGTGWNSRSYRDAGYPLQLGIEEPILLSHQQSSVDTPDLSDCARQGEWRPIGEILINSNQKDLQQEHDYLIPSGSHDSQQGGNLGLYGSNFGSGEHSFHDFYGGGGGASSQGSFAEFQKLTADAASAQSTHNGFDLNQHFQKYAAGSASSYAPGFGGLGDAHGGNSVSYSSDFGKIPSNHNVNGFGGDQNGGHKFYHGQGNVLSGSGYGKPKQPSLGSFGSGGPGAFFKGKPGGHHIRYGPGGFNFNRKPGLNGFGDGFASALPHPPKGPFIKGKKPGIPWKSHKIKVSGGGGGGFRRPNLDSFKSGPYVDASGSSLSGNFYGGHGGSASSGPFFGGHGGSISSASYSNGPSLSTSSANFLTDHGSSDSAGLLFGKYRSTPGSFGGHGHGESGSSGVIVGAHAGAGSSEGFGAGHGGYGSSLAGSLLNGNGDSASSPALLTVHGGLDSSSGGGIAVHGGYSGNIPVSFGVSSSGSSFGGFGGSGLKSGHKGTVEGSSLYDNNLLAGHPESMALASAFTDHSYIGQNVGQITHEAILQDASQLTSFTCGKNHDHGTNYHTASFQVSDDDHGSQDVLQYQDGAHVIIHAANNGFDDVIHAERKQSEEGGDSSASATKESSLEIITGSVKGASNHRYAESGNNDENSGTSDQIEEPTSHNYYRDKFSSTENSPIQFGSASEKPQIIKELEELASRFQLDRDNGKYTGISYETFFADGEPAPEKANPVIHNGFSIVNVNDFDYNPKGERYRYEDYKNDGDVITEYPYYTVHQERNGPESLPVVIAEHHPHKGDKPKAHIPPKRKHPGKQYEVHENSGEKQIPTTEIFPPQKFPRQFHNPMPNLAAGRPQKDNSKYIISSYQIPPGIPLKKFKKYKPIPGKVKYRRPIPVRRPIPITSSPIVRVSVSS